MVQFNYCCNHAATGIDVPPPFCKADFFAESYITCSGDSLYFQDYSYHNPISWQWNFEGASVNNSNFQNAFANYPLPGVYDVSLTASGDSINYLTELKSDKVIVMDYQGQSLPYLRLKMLILNTKMILQGGR